MKVSKDIHKHKHYSEHITVFLSVLCTIHCVLTPVIIVMMPVAAAYFIQYHWVEYVIIASVFVLGTSAILHGYKNHHHHRVPAFIFFFGLILLCSGSVIKLFFHVDDISTHLLSGIGGIACGIGQLYNLKLSK